VLEQAERVFHVDAHRGGQPAHVAEDSQDAQQREVAEQFEKGRSMKPQVSSTPKGLGRSAAKAPWNSGPAQREAVARLEGAGTRTLRHQTQLNRSPLAGSSG